VNCDTTKKLLDGYLDGELDAVTNEAIEEHRRTCPECQSAYADRNILVGAVRNAMPYHKAPDELRQRIRLALRNGRRSVHSTDFVPPPPVSAPSDRRVIPFPMSWRSITLAAAALVIAALVLTRFGVPAKLNPSQSLATEVISGHARSLLANHLTDVASSDQHTVKPWLDSKIDFAPPVPDLASDGFPLIGGRLDYLDNRTVAVLVYQRRKHFINLFIWPADRESERTTEKMTRQGYQLTHWVDGTFTYLAISDVNAGDLDSFKQLFQKQVSPN
jgi:anti-sigma factor RsiW